MTLNIRIATEDDIPLLQQIAKGMGARHQPDYFERCLLERSVHIAEISGTAAGYAQLNRAPAYEGFSRQNIPEVQDLCVLPDFRRQGTGAALVTHCEALARAEGAEHMGISVGLDRGYGAAQRLYVRLGYVPDGAGMTYDDSPVRFGDIRPIDDLLALKMVKHLAKQL